tara:strand:- start:601 stop:825 length:225 start_codon:yes stop_codon:yes gene_type:complete
MPKKILNSSEMEGFAESICNILEDVPLYYIIEVLELAKSHRDSIGDIHDLDVSDEEVEEEVEESSSSSSETESD